MNARHLEHVWRIVSQRINETVAANPMDAARTDPLIKSCIAQVAGACWARRGGKCGIYGA